MRNKLQKKFSFIEQKNLVTYIETMDASEYIHELKKMAPKKNVVGDEPPPIPMVEQLFSPKTMIEHTETILDLKFTDTYVYNYFSNSNKDDFQSVDYMLDVLSIVGKINVFPLFSTTTDDLAAYMSAQFFDNVIEVCIELETRPNSTIDEVEQFIKAIGSKISSHSQTTSKVCRLSTSYDVVNRSRMVQIHFNLDRIDMQDTVYIRSVKSALREIDV